MPWRVEYLDWARCANLIFEGASSKADVERSVIALIGSLTQHGVRKILTDFSGATSVEVSPIDVSQLPAQFKDLGLKDPFIEAVVAPRGGGMHETARYYETLCTNRGNTVRLFDTRAEAMSWLASKN